MNISKGRTRRLLNQDRFFYTKLKMTTLMTHHCLP